MSAPGDAVAAFADAMRSAENPLLHAAMDYAVELGWLVFPCKASGKPPLTANGFKDASRDEATIFTWWTKWPDANVAVPTGAVNGIWVLDVDIRADRNGEAALVELEAEHWELPLTVMQRTPSGGTHLFFRNPQTPVGNTAGKLGPGLDTRGDGGYVVITPSVIGGARYRWVLAPGEVELAAPTWPLDLLAAPPPERKPAPTPRPRSPQDLSPYARAALDSAVRRITRAAAGEQHTVLNREVFAIGGLVAGGLIPAALALEALRWAAGRMPSFDARRPWRPAELDRQIRDAFVDGQLHAREAPYG